MLFVITDAQNELAPCSIVDTISSNFSIQMMTTCIAEHVKSNLIANLQRKHPGNVIWMHIGSTRPISQLDMSTARRLQHPSHYTVHLPIVTVMVMNDRLTSLLFHVNQHPPPPPHSSNKTISNFDLETTRSRSWVWSKGKTWRPYSQLSI